MAYTDHAPGQGRGWRRRRAAALHIGLTEPSAQKFAEKRQVFGPSGQVEIFFKLLIYQKIGFPLEDLGGLVGAVAFVAPGLLATFLAARWGGVGVFFCGATPCGGGGAVPRHLAGIVGDEKPDGRFPHAVAVDALHAQPDRGGQEGGYPEPNERCAGEGRHCVIRHLTTRQNYT